MKVNINQDHGLIVWGKMANTTGSWAGLIISVKLMDFIFEEKPNNTWVWWLHHNTFSLVKNDLIFNFFLDFESHSKNSSGKRKNGILEAIQMASVRYEFDIPQNVILSDSLIPWASKNIEALTKNKMGKSKRNEPYIIPNDIIQKMVDINLKNVQAAINFKIEETLKNENDHKKIKDSFPYGKKKCQFCIACKVVDKSLPNKHPLFRGSICDSCHINAKQFLMPVAKDLSNICCCICFTFESSDLILCDFCVRVFCNRCLSLYSVSHAFDTIKRVQNWECFACTRNSSCSLSCLVNLSIEKQLQNIYNFYPADNPESDIMKKELKNQKIQVLAVHDDQNIVSTILEDLKFPFRLVGTNYLDDIIFDPKKQNVKLLIQYYPNCEDYDEKKFDCYGTLEEFFSFFYLKTELENIEDPNNKSLYWAFEASASITYHELNVISRFLKKKPILIGMETKHIRQRARFIWSNITILNKNIEQFINQDIIHHNISERNTNDDKDQTMPWCYSSVYSILNSLIQNNIFYA